MQFGLIYIINPKKSPAAAAAVHVTPDNDSDNPDNDGKAEKNYYQKCLYFVHFVHMTLPGQMIKDVKQVSLKLHDATSDICLKHTTIQIKQNVRGGLNWHA